MQPSFVVIALAFICGCFLGSFLCVLIDRLSTGRSFVKGRSYCEHCKKTLQPIDLIPLFSYLFLNGKCRYCHHKIPFRLFYIEFLAGVIVASLASFLHQGFISPLSAISLCAILLCFTGIFFADIIYGIIPDAFSIAILLFSFLYLFSINSSMLNHLLAGLGALAFFLVLFVATKGRGMGFGDVKLSFVLGFLLGFPGIVVALYIAFLTGAVVSLILVIWKKLRFFGGTIPFGPFLIISAIAALFYGDTLLQAFMARFL
jgi:leader peptidase (prepilin peptidase)/N-methyltransferase